MYVNVISNVNVMKCPISATINLVYLVAYLVFPFTKFQTVKGVTMIQ